MAVAKKCDRCGVFYEATDERVYVTEDGFKINSIRIGDWDQKNRSWNAIGSAYDLCDKCGREVYEAIFAPENCTIKIRTCTNVKKSGVPSFNKKAIAANQVNSTSQVEIEQQKFATEEKESEDVWNQPGTI